jgi:hypothetical protein
MKFINGPTMKALASVILYTRARGGEFLQLPNQSKVGISIMNYVYGIILWELCRQVPEILDDSSKYLRERREEMVGRWWDIWGVEKVGASTP